VQVESDCIMKTEKTLYEVKAYFDYKQAWVDPDLITFVSPEIEYQSGGKKLDLVNLHFTDRRNSVSIDIPTWEKLKKASGIKIKTVKI